MAAHIPWLSRGCRSGHRAKQMQCVSPVTLALGLKFYCWTLSLEADPLHSLFTSSLPELWAASCVQLPCSIYMPSSSAGSSEKARKRFCHNAAAVLRMHLTTLSTGSDVMFRGLPRQHSHSLDVSLAVNFSSISALAANQGISPCSELC